MVDTDEKLPINDFKGNEEGFLQVVIDPCTASGGALGDNDFVDDPKELVGKPLSFKIKIKNAKGLDAKYDKVR